MAGLSFQGLTMAVISGQFVGYVAFDTIADANRAAAILGDEGSARGRRGRWSRMNGPAAQREAP